MRRAAAAGVEDEDRVLRVGEIARVRQPSAVAGPTHVEPREATVQPVERLVDVRHLTRRDVEDVDAHRLIDERDFLAVGRPVRLIAEPRSELGDRALFAGAVGVAQRELVLAGLVAPVRDELAVGRPGRRALGRCGRFGEVADRAVLRGNGEQVAVRLEERALARRRERCRRDLGAHVLGMRAKRRAIRHDAHRDLVHLLGGDVEEIHAAPRLKDDVGRAERRILHVEVAEVGDLMEAHRLGVDAQMLPRSFLPRSERKKSVEPDHIGCPSLASSWVMFLDACVSRSQAPGKQYVI